jgi:hypothetical protein
MGANSFSTAAFGKTPREAFNAAQERARYEHGHSGYSGTIAEKYDFVQVALPKGVTLPSFLKLLAEAEELSYGEYLAQDLRDHERMGVGARKTWGGKTLKQAQAEYAKQKRKEDRFWTRVGKTPGLTQALKQAGPMYYGDKWGPALCLGPITGKQMRDRMTWAVGAKQEHKDGRWQYRKPRGQNMYLFLGYASS